MVDLSKAIPKYLEILEGRRLARFKQESFLVPKMEYASRMLERCVLCERRCRADRSGGKLGYCRAKGRLSVGGYYADSGNDLPPLCPNFNVFFLGCNLRCVFCQNHRTSQAVERPVKITERGLARIIDSRSLPRVLVFVGGEPTPQLPFILNILFYLRRNIPVMWHSNFFMSPEAMKFLKGVVDVYSPTLKFGNDACAKRLSGTKDYMAVVGRNLIAASEDSEVVVRHLVLPNHAECCSKPLLRFVAETLGDRVLVHLMGQYAPEWKAKNYPEIGKAIKKKEFSEIVSFAEGLGLNYIAE